MRRPRALLVDDDLLSLRMVGRMLDADFDVVLATSGVEAIERLDEGGSFDALVVDVNMPGTADGVDVYRRIRRKNGGGPLFVFMTGDPRAAEVLPRTSPVVCLRKPFDATQLYAALAPVLQRSS